MNIILTFLVVILFTTLLLGFVWVLYRHETHPDKKHNPPDPEHLKCRPTQGAGKGL